MNNAGIATGASILQHHDDLIEKTMAVNTMAHFWVCITVMLVAEFTYNLSHRLLKLLVPVSYILCHFYF